MPAGSALDGPDGLNAQHLGLHLQIIVIALPSNFFLMRFEIVYALSDFIAL